MMIQQQGTIDKRTRLKWRQGRMFKYAPMENDRYADYVDDDEHFLTSEPILGGQHFYLRVKSGYKVAFVKFFDRELRKALVPSDAAQLWEIPSGGTLVRADELISTDTLGHNGRKTGQRTWIPVECYIRITVCRDDVVLAEDAVTSGSTISPTDDVVDAFYLFDTVFAPRDKGTNFTGSTYGAYKPLYRQGMKVAKQINAAYTHSRVATSNPMVNGGADGYLGYDLPTSYCVGIPYEAVVCQRVGSMSHGFPSMETYLSLWTNRRSLMYTESPKSHITNYGITWNSNNATVGNYGRLPYGMVCNNAVSSVLGIPERVDETNIWDPGNTGTGMVTSVYSDIATMVNDNGAKLRPFDVVYWSGHHVFIITDIFTAKTKNGEERFIEYLESSNCCQLYLATASSLGSTLSKQSGQAYKFVRPNPDLYKMAGRFFYRETPGLPEKPRERSHYVPNEDICTFMGDKCTLAVGDPLWLNVREYNPATQVRFNQIKLYRKDDGGVYQLETTLVMSEPAAKHRKTYDDGTIWDIDVSAQFTDASSKGLWKATAYNSGTGAESEGTFFEVIDMGVVDVRNVYNANSQIVRVSDSVAESGKEGFVQAIETTYFPKRNGYLTHAHHLTRGIAERKYGISLVDLQGSTENHRGMLMLKGEYGYCKADAAGVNVSGLQMSSATTTQNTRTAIAASGKLQPGLDGITTYITPVPSNWAGRVYTFIFNDRMVPKTYASRVTQYNAANDGEIGSATMISTKVLRSTLETEATWETRMVSVEIKEGCTYIAWCSPVANKFPVVRTAVILPDLVKEEDKGYDAYFGIMPLAPETKGGILDGMTAAELLMYAKPITTTSEGEYTHTVEPGDVYKSGCNSGLVLLWKEGCEPSWFTIGEGIFQSSWESEHLMGASEDSDRNWAHKTLTLEIGGEQYHAAIQVMNLTARTDKIVIQF